jgi:hypothetical protein
MGTGYINKTDIYAIHGIIQNVMLSHPKALIIETLRDEFSRDSYYHYVRDNWGFPETPDMTGKPVESGLKDDVATRLFIGEAFRNDVKFYPSIVVRAGGFRSVPISMSRNEGVLQYKATRYFDGYGNERIVSEPDYFSLAGAWEGQILIEVTAEGTQARDHLVEAVSAILTITNFKVIANAGVVIKPLSGGATSEVDDGKHKLYKQVITCDIRTEWNQIIPVNTILQTISFCVDFGNLSVTPPTLAPNLEGKTLIEIMAEL